MLDTIEKRASSLGGIGWPFRLTLPWPSGSIDVEERAHLSGSYALDFLPPAPLLPDVICFDFIIDGITASIAIEHDLATIAIERDLAIIRLVECDD